MNKKPRGINAPAVCTLSYRGIYEPCLTTRRCSTLLYKPSLHIQHKTTKIGLSQYKTASNKYTSAVCKFRYLGLYKPCLHRRCSTLLYITLHTIPPYSHQTTQVLKGQSQHKLMPYAVCTLRNLGLYKPCLTTRRCSTLLYTLSLHIQHKTTKIGISQHKTASN